MELARSTMAVTVTRGKQLGQAVLARTYADGSTPSSTALKAILLLSVPCPLVATRKGFGCAGSL
eukprot:1996702-Rhodomonas_salina.1